MTIPRLRLGSSPADTVLQAVVSRSAAEDQLTEVFACVLNKHRPLRRALLDRLGFTDLADAKVEVQVRTGFGARTMDMRLLCNRSDDRLAPVEVWFEHKHASRFGPKQLDNYERAMSLAADAGDEIRFCVLLWNRPTHGEAEQLSSMQASTLYWDDIADLADSCLVATDPDWHTTFEAGGGSAAQMLLWELLFYLEDVIDMPDAGPLEDKHLHALINAAEAEERVIGLLSRTADRVCESDEAGGFDKDELIYTTEIQGWWSDTLKGAFELEVGSDSVQEDTSDAIMWFFAGVTFDAPGLSGPMAHSIADAADAAGLIVALSSDEAEDDENHIVWVGSQSPLIGGGTQASPGRSVGSTGR